eukprot:EG_transcript_37129
MLDPGNVLKVEENCLRGVIQDEEAQAWEALAYILALMLMPRVPVLLAVHDAERLGAEEFHARLSWEAQEEIAVHRLRCEGQEGLERLQLAAKEHGACLALSAKFSEATRKRWAAAETAARRRLEAEWEAGRAALEG